MVRGYDKAEIRRAWEEYTKGCESQYPWEEDIVEEVADLVEQSRWEASKGRMDVLSIEEAVQIVADAR